MNRVLIVLPHSPCADYTCERITRLAERYFPDQRYVTTFAAGKTSAALAHPQFAGRARVLDDRRIADSDILVVSEEILASRNWPGDKRLYVLEHNHWHVFFRLVNQSIDERDYPAIAAHEFNRNGPKLGSEQIMFFPYGHLFRECAIGGPLDPFGFRIGVDVAPLVKRPPTHKLVAVLGGSAAWSWYCFFEETFCALLEQSLQTYLDGRRAGETVSVLNFGQGSAVVLNEITTFLLHVERLRPDVVISHDGFNDVFWGLTGDPFLLSRDICTPYLFEAWSQKLHDRSDVSPRLPHGHQIPVVNFPRPIAKAYVERKRQLDRVIRSSGAVHVPALQPHARSKKLSAIERENLANRRYLWLWEEPQRLLPAAYAELSRSVDNAHDLNVLNLHRQFAEFGPNETLFQDTVHTVPLGDRKIADAYCAHIIDRQLI